MNKMIKDALKYIVSLGEANVRDIVLPNGVVQTYSDKPLELIEEKYIVPELLKWTIYQVWLLISSQVLILCPKK